MPLDKIAFYIQCVVFSSKLAPDEVLRQKLKSTPKNNKKVFFLDATHCKQRLLKFPLTKPNFVSLCNKNNSNRKKCGAF
jgi:hypothetical protein